VPVIKNYGFLWERKYLNRGSGGQGNSGRLEGYATPKNRIVDFREQIGIYVLYDRNQHIVYVGQAGNGNATLFTRLKNHMDGSLWNRWEYFTWIGFRDVNDSGVARLSDKQSIESQVSSYKYSDALDEIEGILIEEYYQSYDDPVKGPSNEELMEEIKSLKELID
jgi:hypothetical protein